METRAYLKGTRLSPQKAALVADQIRGRKVEEAMDFLVFNKQKSSMIIKKLLESAIANAENNNNADIIVIIINGKNTINQDNNPSPRLQSIFNTVAIIPVANNLTKAI